MEYFIGKRLLVGVFIMITGLLGANAVFTYQNSKRIEANRLLQQRSETVKMMVSQIAIDIIHNLDLGIRSYGLFKDPRYLYPYYKALDRKDSILSLVEALLAEDDYNLEELRVLKDSIEKYVALNAELKILVDKNNDKQFLNLANQDRGYQLWLQYERFAAHVNGFQDEIVRNARQNYNTALSNNYYVQLLLFIICIPTLLFTIVRTLKNFVLEKKLRHVETERANLLATQKERLEQIVDERTKELIQKNRNLQKHDEEIAAQNEAILTQNNLLVKQQDQIAAQRDLLTLQYEKLTQDQEIILAQQKEIEQKNRALNIEVERKTNELLNNNQQLEQFAFVSAHNLRAPVARILGLGNLLKYERKDEDEEKLIIAKIIKSTIDLDMVVKDLMKILAIKTNINAQLNLVNFSEELQLVKSNLAREIWENSCEITECFEDAPSVVTVKAYIDSILFNLITNSIKYRSPDRNPVINLKSLRVNNDFVCLEVQDNGLGIDLQAYGNEIFSLYKRFHTHTEGKGLGLHLVKMQAIALGGSVAVSSEPGVGSIFTVYIKTHLATAENEHAPADGYRSER